MFLYLGVFVTFFATMEIVKRMANFAAEDTRKVVHAGTSTIVCSMPFFVNTTEILILAAGFIGLLSVTKFYGLFSAVQGVKRKTIGEFAFAVGAGLAAVFLLPQHPEAFICGFVVLGISDTAAQIIGEWKPIRSFRIFSQSKSLGGSTAFFLATLVILFSLARFFEIEVEVLRLTLAAMLVTLVEFSQVFGIDNLLIPISTGLLFEWMQTSF